MTPTLFEGVRAVLFDLDGTLYDQRALRLHVAFEMLGYYCLRPLRLYELYILSTFRHERERHAGVHSPHLAQDQYDWVATRLGISPESVVRIVEQWMYVAPLKYLRACKPDALDQYLAVLRTKGIMIGVCSDYPASDKLAALGISADATASATDESVTALKPNPASFLRVAEMLGIPPSSCLVIGDRIERDGEAAERAGMRFLKATASNEFYISLEENFKQSLATRT